jgi:fibronectin-binding autotransporter adhesin
MYPHRLDRVRRNSLAKGIFLALAPILVTPFLTGTAYAACTTASPVITCATGSNTNNVSSNINNVTVNVQTGAVVSVPPLLGGTAMTLSGNGITLNNQGSIDPSINGGLSLAASGAVLGNSSGNLINVNNQAGGSINGLFNIASLFGFGGQALVTQNGTGGVSTINNSGTIGMSIFGGLGSTADAAAVISYGGGQTNFTNNTGATITGRIGFGATTAAGGNTFLNAGTINGSVYLGDTVNGNTFTAVSGSSVNNAVGTAGAGTVSWHQRRETGCCRRRRRRHRHRQPAGAAELSHRPWFGHGRHGDHDFRHELSGLPAPHRQ